MNAKNQQGDIFIDEVLAIEELADVVKQTLFSKDGVSRLWGVQESTSTMSSAPQAQMLGMQGVFSIQPTGSSLVKLKKNFVMHCSQKLISYPKKK